MSVTILINLDCPCNINCSNGCNGCSNPICVCGEHSSPQNQDNLSSIERDKTFSPNTVWNSLSRFIGCKPSVKSGSVSVQKSYFLVRFEVHDCFFDLVRYDSSDLFMFINLYIFVSKKFKRE